MSDKIFVKLTEVELAERSRMLAQKVCEFESMKDDLRGYSKERRDEMKGVAEEIQELATQIRSGHEERDAAELPGVRKLRASE